MTSRGARWFGVACLAASIVLSALGQLAMKNGMRHLHLAGAGEIAQFTAPPMRAAVFWTVVGLTAYGASLLAWLAVLVRYRLSYAYPLLALSYVLVYAGATHWPQLLEPATPTRTIGTLLILAGVALASLTGERTSR